MHCTFCGKNKDEVAILIAGPGVNICIECVFVCLRIMLEGAIEGPKAKDFKRD